MSLCYHHCNSVHLSQSKLVLFRFMRLSRWSPPSRVNPAPQRPYYCAVTQLNSTTKPRRAEHSPPPSPPHFPWNGQFSAIHSHNSAKRSEITSKLRFSSFEQEKVTERNTHETATCKQPCSDRLNLRLLKHKKWTTPKKRLKCAAHHHTITVISITIVVAIMNTDAVGKMATARIPASTRATVSGISIIIYRLNR